MFRNVLIGIVMVVISVVAFVAYRLAGDASLAAAGVILVGLLIMMVMFWPEDFGDDLLKPRARWRLRGAHMKPEYRQQWIDRQLARAPKKR